MDETAPDLEGEQYSRDQVVAVLHRLADRGFTNPDDLPLDDPEVIEAHRILDSWSKQADQSTQDSPPAAPELEFSLRRDTIYVDAGFLDPDYLDEVANDFLAQDEQNARDQGLDELADKIRAKADEINGIIQNQTGVK